MIKYNVKHVVALSYYDPVGLEKCHVPLPHNTNPLPNTQLSTTSIGHSIDLLHAWDPRYPSIQSKFCQNALKM